MVKSKLPNNVLGKIWKLSDVDKDGMTYKKGGPKVIMGPKNSQLVWLLYI